MPLQPRVLDLGLNTLDTEVTDIVILSALATTYAEANATFTLGRNVFGAGNAFGAPATASPNGRKVTSVAITAGNVTASGTASHWAAIDTVNARLLCSYPLASSQAVTSGNNFSIPAFDVRLPDQ